MELVILVVMDRINAIMTIIAVAKIRRVGNVVELLNVLDAPPPPTGRNDIPAVLEELRVSALDPSPDRRIETARACLSLIERWSGYRRSSTALEEYYRHLIGRPRTGMSEMFAMARADGGSSTVPLDVQLDTDGEDGWAPWWTDQPSEEPEPTPPPPLVARVSHRSESPGLHRVPAEYLPLPSGAVEPDAPRVRRRPRRSPPESEPGVPCVEPTERLPPVDAPRTAEGGKDGEA
ncbi:MAG: hypothetical protein AB1Z98_26745 [Nannocystaceae bacterium]